VIKAGAVLLFDIDVYILVLLTIVLFWCISGTILWKLEEVWNNGFLNID